jgi:hypothetical protein
LQTIAGACNPGTVTRLLPLQVVEAVAPFLWSKARLPFCSVLRLSTHRAASLVSLTRHPAVAYLFRVRPEGGNTKKSLLTAILISIFFGTSVFSKEHCQNASPDALVRELYKIHETKKDPFAHPKTLLGDYFDKSLLSLYLQDSAGGEVGKLEFDPLYHAQDFEIKDLAVAGVTQQKNSAEVAASFKNIGTSEKILFYLSLTERGWRISDIKYSDGQTLKGILK